MTPVSGILFSGAYATGSERVNSEPFPGTLLTITRVECSTSLFQCKVFISVMPEDNFDNVLSLLKRHIYDIQQILNKKLKMRPVPKIEFIKETKTKEAGRIEELLAKIRKEDIEKNE